MDQTGIRSPDLFGRTHEMDDRTLELMATRLEARGQHPFFRRAIDDYLAALDLEGDEAILDLGCGTGVAARRIAARPAQVRPVTAIDISAHLIAAARRHAEAEGLAAKLDFRTGDAHGLGVPEGGFDVVVMHTLLTHVADPATVLAEARRLLRPGGRLVVFDIDIASLTFATDAPDGGAASDAALQRILGANPRVMRALPGLLAEAGFALDSWRGHQAFDVGRVDFWASGPPAWRVLLVKAGAMSQAESDAFAAALERASAASRFFGGANFHSYLARRGG